MILNPSRFGHGFLLLALSLLFYSWAYAQEDDAGVRLEALQAQIKALSQRLGSGRAELDELHQSLRRLDATVGAVVGEIRQLKQRREQLDVRSKALEKDRAWQQERLRQQRRQLSEQLRASYLLGRQQRLKILLNQEDPDRLSRILTYYDFFHRARSREIHAVRETLASLAELEAALAANRVEVDAVVATLARRRTELEQVRVRQTELALRLERELSAGDERLNALREDEQALKDLIESLEKGLADIPADPRGSEPFANQQGTLPWPTKGRLSVRFGSRSQRYGTVSTGVLIEAGEGQEVRAVSHGRVAFADWLRGFGLMIILDHGDGYLTLYGNNQALLKDVGEWVQEGDAIAVVGRSGGRSKSALYFEIRQRGEPLDPLLWCRRARGNRVG
ncbi:MAG: peptidoglycan DD-metalloendopeptidase family protein [Chromatiales bacterium]|nr:peptidoglycan DD-metalloendopeptidase family protein [Chromatiales bacterium]